MNTKQIRPLQELIEAILAALETPPRATLGETLPALDLRALNLVAGHAANPALVAALSPSELHEVGKWRLNRDLSIYPEIQAL